MPVKLWIHSIKWPNETCRWRTGRAAGRIDGCEGKDVLAPINQNSIQCSSTFKQLPQTLRSTWRCLKGCITGEEVTSIQQTLPSFCPSCITGWAPSSRGSDVLMCITMHIQIKGGSPSFKMLRFCLPFGFGLTCCFYFCFSCGSFYFFKLCPWICL